MAVYTYFDGMPGLLGAVRQEGFSQLAGRLGALDASDDAVADLAAAGAAYAQVAREWPELYVLMFDGALPLPDAAAADASLQYLVGCIARAVELGRFDAELDPRRFANEVWMLGHGACMLLATGVLTFDQVEPVVTSGLVRLYTAAGDDQERAARSLDAGWSSVFRG